MRSSSLSSWRSKWFIFFTSFRCVSSFSRSKACFGGKKKSILGREKFLQPKNDVETEIVSSRESGSSVDKPYTNRSGWRSKTCALPLSRFAIILADAPKCTVATIDGDVCAVLMPMLIKDEMLHRQKAMCLLNAPPGPMYLDGWICTPQRNFNIFFMSSQVRIL